MTRATLILATVATLAGEASSRKLSAWRGERVAYKCVVSNGSDVAKTVGGPALRAPSGWRIRSGVLRDHIAYDVPRTGVTTLPDRVEWNGRRCLAPHETCLAAVEITVPPEADAGLYDLGEGVSMRVVGRTLPPPSQWRYYLDLWQHPWAVARTSGTEPFSEAHFAAMRPLWEQLAGAGAKVLTTTLLDLPWNHQCSDAYHSMIGRVRRTDGSWTFDYSVFDRYVEFGRSCGLGPDIACYSLCPWGYVVRWRDESGAERSCECRPGTSAFDDYWGHFLDDFARHLREKGWFGNVYLALDERAPEDMRKICAFIRAKDPGWKIFLAGNIDVARFGKLDVDCYSQQLKHATPAFAAGVKEWRAAGRKVTIYTATDRPPYPNCWAESDTDGSFWLGAAPAPLGLDGFLRWAYNSWEEDAYADLRHSVDGQRWAAGATHFVYPDGTPAYRFLELVNGIQQAEKWWMLLDENPSNPALADLTRRYAIENFKTADAGHLKRLKADTLAVLNAE